MGRRIRPGDDSTHSTLDSSLHAWTKKKKAERRRKSNVLAELSSDYTVIRK